MKFKITLIILLFHVCSVAQNRIEGVVYGVDGRPLAFSNVVLQGTAHSAETNDKGYFILDKLSEKKYHLIVFSYGFEKHEQEVVAGNGVVYLNINLQPIQKSLPELIVEEKRSNDFGMSYMNSVEGTAIYASKKNEVILLEDVNGNKSVNNARQTYAKVAGMNIWESDGAGLQLGVGARGLNPNRTTNFNTRQNGYDISADALGYPESYYSPPVEALERIEVIRGAASLQYGTQFGGVLNFILKKGVKNKPIETVVRQTVGSFGLLNSSVGVGGTRNTINYYGFVQYKQGNGWRENSGFDSKTTFFNVNKQFTSKLNIGLEYTYMDYLARQAGGLTDSQFEEDPRISTRNRNWFAVNWNMAALLIDYRLSPFTNITSKTFGLYSSRNALGELGRIDRPDPLLNRDLISGDFKNFGNETRLLHRYNLVRKLPSALVVGMRYYNGNTTARQGEANNGYAADFYYLNQSELLSDYKFTNNNFSAFAENVFNLSEKLSITPGVRYEYINTQSNGSYNSDFRHPNTDQILSVIDSAESKSSERNITLSGIGTSYKPLKGLEIYANFSQNYRAINFSDIKIVNPNLRVDENMTDESGWNSDLGIRGKHKNYLAFDVTVFYLIYNNRIGAVLKKDTDTYQTYRLRTNIGDAQNKGIESFVEVDLLKAFSSDTLPLGFSVFSNLAVIDARYITSLDPSIKVGNRVEYVPLYNFKSGFSLKYKKLKISYQYSFVSEQYTEATNAVKPLPVATDGVIPAYRVMDVTLNYTYKRYTVETGINNLLNTMYYTRRATAYPGPGIIPSDGRSFFLTLQVKV